jgi:hypothetical protein
MVAITSKFKSTVRGSSYTKKCSARLAASQRYPVASSNEEIHIKKSLLKNQEGNN